MRSKMSILISLYAQYRFNIKRIKYMLNDLFYQKYSGKIFIYCLLTRCQTGPPIDYKGSKNLDLTNHLCLD